MKVFVTGATGTVGKATVDALAEAGYDITGMARSDEGVASLRAKGITPVKADLGSLDIIKAEAAKADAVIHLAFIHDMAKMEQALPTELAVVGAIMDALDGSSKIFLATSGTAVLGDVNGAAEDAAVPNHPFSARAQAEVLLAQGAQHNIRSAAIRLPIFGYEESGSHLLLQIMRMKAKEQDAALYVGSGAQEISVVNVRDVADLYVQALQHAKAGAIYHAVDATVTLKELAEAIGAGLGLPTKSITPNEASEIYGPFLGHVFSISNVTDSAKTCRELQWEPTVGSKSEFLAAAAGEAA